MKKKLYHLCVSSGEVMFLVTEDYYQGINKAFLTAYRYDTKILAYAFMSNHFHIVAETANPSKYVAALRIGYTKWFNYKYGREGSLGLARFHSVELTTFEHTLDAITYVLRNGVHHNVVAYPSGYPFCSVRYYFMKEYGTSPTYEPILSWKEERKFIPWKTKLPQGYVLDANGLLIHDNILETKIVENYYRSVRNFAYHMNKVSALEWTVLNVESWMRTKVKKQLDYKKITERVRKINDLEVCLFIDEWMAQNKKGSSFMMLRKKDMFKVAALLREKRASLSQLARCLPYPLGVLEKYFNNEIRAEDLLPDPW